MRCTSTQWVLSGREPGAGVTGLVSSPFGRTPAGDEVARFRLTGAAGIEVDILTFGARIHSLRVPDRNSNLADVILGYDELSDYENDRAYHGAIVGRTAGRISRGTFVVDGQEYHLAHNNGEHTIHGGIRGFDRRVWEVAETIDDGREVRLTLRYHSPDGEEGFPGNLDTLLSYAISPSNELSIEYRVTTDRATPLIMTQHAYFNLSGQGSGEALHHELSLDADLFAPLASDLIPTGSLSPVVGTPFDFRAPRRVGDRIDADDEQLRVAQGYDHYFVLNRPGATDVPAATLSDPHSGRRLEMFTTEPGIQLYTSNLLAHGSGKRGARYHPRAGLCLEAQHFPDAPNHPSFPSAILRPETPRHSRTTFRFTAR